MDSETEDNDSELGLSYEYGHDEWSDQWLANESCGTNTNLEKEKPVSLKAKLASLHPFVMLLNLGEGFFKVLSLILNVFDAILHLLLILLHLLLELLHLFPLSSSHDPL